METKIELSHRVKCAFDALRGLNQESYPPKGVTVLIVPFDNVWRPEEPEEFRFSGNLEKGQLTPYGTRLKNWVDTVPLTWKDKKLVVTHLFKDPGPSYKAGYFTSKPGRGWEVLPPFWEEGMFLDKNLVPDLEELAQVLEVFKPATIISASPVVSWALTGLICSNINAVGRVLTTSQVTASGIPVFPIFPIEVAMQTGISRYKEMSVYAIKQALIQAVGRGLATPVEGS